MKQIWKQSLLMVVLVLAMAVPVFAADFSDVTDANWYAEDLDLMVELGVISGYEDGTFRPQNPVTFGEFSKMLCSLTGVEAEEKTSNHWASGFVNAVYEAGWLGGYPSDLDASISRYEVAEAVFHMMGCAEDATLESPFMDLDDVVATTLYALDIMKGSEENGQRVFLPSADVTRAEICAILTRVEDSDATEVSDVEWTEEEILEVTYTYTVPEVSKPSSTGSNTVNYYEQVILYMMANDLQSYSVEFPGVTGAQLEAAGMFDLIANAFIKMQGTYEELGCFYEYSGCKWSEYNGNTTVSIEIGDYDFTNAQIKEQKAVFIKEVNKLIQSMLADGSIDENKSDYSNAMYFYKWCAINLAYDFAYQPESYNGYGALTSGKAVCQGYAAVFNALCNAFDIVCVGVQGEANGGTHAWNYAKLDGKWLYVDATFGDPTPDKLGYCDPSYFGLTKDEISDTHTLHSVFES